MSQTASGLAEIVRTNSVTVLRTRPFEGKWTPNQIIGHLADDDWVYGYRLRLILCEDTPIILGMNQAWRTCDRRRWMHHRSWMSMFLCARFIGWTRESHEQSVLDDQERHSTRR